MALFPTYNRFDLSVAKASGTIVEDINGKEYLDFGSGIGVCNLGHRHPAVQQAVEKQLNEYWHLSNLYKIPIQEDVAKLITDNSVGEYVFFCNSGAEANEAAIKLARKATGKEKIITFEQSFHGRTFATMAATGQEKVRIGFGAMLQEFSYATFNDIDSVKAVLDDNTAAVMLEVVQGEGGVIPAKQAFLDELVAICKAKGVLIIIDEIQTGIGRTAKGFAYEHFGIEPDIFTLAKGLGNGLPVGAMVAKEQYGKAFGPGSHGSTFGGNPLAMAAAKAVLTFIFKTGFLQTVEKKGNYLYEKLNEQLSGNAHVKEIRHLGLMVGIQCDQDVSKVVPALLEKGVLVLNAGETVVRLLPPLTTTEAEIDKVIGSIAEVLNKL